MFKDEHFERFYLAHLLRDDTFISYVRPDLDPDFFKNTTHRILVQLTLEYYDTYNAPPQELIYQDLDEKKYIPSEKKQQVRDLVSELMQLSLRARDRVLKEHENYVRNKKLASVLSDVIDLAKTEEYKQIEGLLHDYLLWRPRGTTDPGKSLDDVEERIARRLEAETEEFYWLIPQLDGMGDLIMRRKQLWFFLSQRSNIGKTAGLVFLTRSFLFQNKKVVYYATEETEEDIQDRLDMCLAGLKTEELTNKLVILDMLQKRFNGKSSDWLRIKAWDEPVTVRRLREHTNLLRNHYGFYPDAIIVDYAGELEPSSTSLIGDLYATGKNIYSDLKHWAKEEDILIWTADQGTRQAAEKQVAGQSDIGQSIYKVQIAHGCVSINRTPAQEETGQTTLFIAKNRGGRGNYPVTIHSDMSRQQFYMPEK